MSRRNPRWPAPALILALLLILGLAVGTPGLAVASPTSTDLPSTAASDTLAQAATGTAPAEPQEVKADAPSSSARQPAVKGKAAVLLNAEDGRVLFEMNADERRPVASTTKIMTGILALETLPLDRKVKASKRADAAGESEIWLEPGEELTVEQLLLALLVKSANDAAVALAEASAGSVEAYVERMNQKAVELGLNNTHFVNPHGLDGKEHYSSARDLALLGRYAMQNEEFRRMVMLPKVNIPWGSREYDRVLQNRNGLIGKVDFVNGIKTGYTGKAGFCLVGSGSRDGVSLVSAILGEGTKQDVYDDTVALLEWGFTRFRPVIFTGKAEVLAQLPIPYTLGDRLPLVTSQALTRTVHVDDEVGRNLTVSPELTLPVEKGQVLGKVSYLVAGEEVGEVDLIASHPIPAPTLGVKVRYFWARFMAWLGNIV